MNREKALKLLGLRACSLPDDVEIRKAWKLKMIKAHPDKSDSSNAHFEAQQLNEAKDVLVGALFAYPKEQEQEASSYSDVLRAKKKHKEEEEMKAKKERDEEIERQKIRKQEHDRKIKEIIEEQKRKREIFEAELKKQNELQRAEKQAQVKRDAEQRKQAAEQERADLFRRMNEQVAAEIEREKMQKEQTKRKQEERAKEHDKWLEEMRRKTPSSNTSSPSPATTTTATASSKSPATTTTASSQSSATAAGKMVGDYKICTELVKEMKVFFSEMFEEKENGEHVVSEDLLGLFADWRKVKNQKKGAISSVEKKLFLKHVHRLFLSQFPSSLSEIIDGKKCFVNVVAKPSEEEVEDEDFC